MTENSNSSDRNKPQANATIPGGVLFVSAGMNLAFSVGWAKLSMLDATRHFCYSWFIGVIIGTIVAIPLMNFFTKKVIIILSSMFVLSGGIIFSIVPGKYDALLAGRYLNGIGVGLITLPFLIHASEIAADGNRGRCLAVEQFCISLGVAIQMIYTSNWGSTRRFSTYSLHGIFDVLLAVLGFAALMFFVESPIDHIRRGDEESALKSFSNLVRPKATLKQTYDSLESHKTYVEEETSFSVGKSLKRGMLPLLKMLLMRSVLLALSFSLPLNAALQYSVFRNSSIWVSSVAAAFRILGSFITLILINQVGRKLSSLIAMPIIGAMLLGLGPLFNRLTSIVDTSNMATAAYLYMCMQCAVGYFTPFTSVYLGEAFPMRVKPYLMAVCVIAEQIIQAVLIYTIDYTTIGNNLMIHGIFYLVIFCIMCVVLPETWNTSLAEAQRRFRKFRYWKLK